MELCKNITHTKFKHTAVLRTEIPKPWYSAVHCAKVCLTFVWTSEWLLIILPLLHRCVWIPLLINELKDVIHYCPNCNSICGVYKRL